MKKTIVLAVVATSLLASAANAGSVNWGSRSKKFAYGVTAAGAALAGAGYLLGKHGASGPGKLGDGLGQFSAGLTMIWAGAAVGAVGAAMYIGDIATDTLSNEAQAAEMSAQHNFIVFQSKSMLDNKTVGSDDNFDQILSAFECRAAGDSCSDASKRDLVAKMIVESDKLGASLRQNETITIEDEVKSEQSIIQMLGENATAKNVGLAKFIAAQGYVSASQK